MQGVELRSEFVKRLNNDAAAKAVAWLEDFGSTQVVPAAVISGVYKLKKLQEAQQRGLTIFWSYNLPVMLHWIESTRPSGDIPATPMARKSKKRR